MPQGPAGTCRRPYEPGRVDPASQRRLRPGVGRIRVAVEEAKPDTSTADHAAMEWLSPAGRRILLITEQGFGDTLQFVRFAPLLKRQGAGKVNLECPEKLIRLLSHSPGIDHLVPQGKPLPDYDVRRRRQHAALPCLNRAGLRFGLDSPLACRFVKPSPRSSR